MRTATVLAAIAAVGLLGAEPAPGPDRQNQGVPNPAPANPAPDNGATARRAAAMRSYDWLLSGGYLGKAGLPASLRLLPPPPAQGSAAQGRDDAAAQATVALRGGPRWILATSDAQLTIASLARDFSCALGIELTPQTTPKTIALLTHATPDLALSTGAAKAAYNRARPFTVDGGPICTPEQADLLRRDGSYPSGHSTVGWGWALILAELAPDRADPLLERAQAFATSRVVCNVHWLSDTEAGRTMAAATVAKLHGDARFRADLEAARAELRAVRGPVVETPRCAAEAPLVAQH